MQISYDWISDYLPFNVSVEELSEILTTIGLEVEDVEKKEKIKGSLQGVVIGEVIHCEQHPNADRLRKTQVKISETEILDIVCGAPNVAQGQKVLVATVGTTLYPLSMPDGLTIKASKIRGEKSEGMLCAEDELGLGQSHDGIMVLPHEAVIGTPAAQYLNLPEPQTVLHIGLTPNRSDAMSHVGVASDVIAYWNYHHKTNYELKYDMPANLEFSGIDQPQIEITNADLSSRFSAVVIDQVKVQESPEWLKSRLESIGIRSINNIVDISNYILHELGQPIHIYDYNAIADHKIFVQNPNQFSELTTLDKQNIKLHPEDIIIADSQKPLGLAGVMGGDSSSVHATTSKILIESASFNPKWIRRTSLRHNLRTEAAVHFEKSTSIDKVDKALLKCVELILQLAEGQISSQLIDIYPHQSTKKTVEFSYDYVRKICGKDYSTEDIHQILNNLGFIFIESNTTHATVLVPFNKTDISLPADIAEEILRIDGLNNVEIKSSITFSINSKKSSDRKVNNKICDFLSHNGFQEILTNSIVNSQNYSQDNIVKMMNSLTVELDAMRPDMCRSGLEVIDHNINRGQKNLLMYEIGNIYSTSGVGQYHQSSVLAIWCTGALAPKQWMMNEERVNIYWLKGVLQNLWVHLGIKKFTIAQDNNTLTYNVGRDVIAKIQILGKKDLSPIGIKQEVIYAEVNLPLLKKYLQTQIQFKPLNKFPMMERDLSIIIASDKKFVEIEKVNAKIKSPLLKSIRVFDIYEGESVGKDKKSWSINYAFQSEERTLTDHEVDDVMKQIMELYTKELNAEIRK